MFSVLPEWRRPRHFIIIYWTKMDCRSVDKFRKIERRIAVVTYFFHSVLPVSSRLSSPWIGGVAIGCTVSVACFFFHTLPVNLPAGIWAHTSAHLHAYRQHRFIQLPTRHKFNIYGSQQSPHVCVCVHMLTELFACANRYNNKLDYRWFKCCRLWVRGG